MGTELTLTHDMMLVLGLVAFTMAMFLFERIRSDATALVVLVVLGITGLVPASMLFSGFSGNAVMSVMATMILGTGLERTGALNRLAAWLLRRANGKEERLIALTSGTAGLMSGFMQNPSVTALFLPVTFECGAWQSVQPISLRQCSPRRKLLRSSFPAWQERHVSDVSFEDLFLKEIILAGSPSAM